MGKPLKTDKWRIYILWRKILRIHICQLFNMFSSCLLHCGDYFINSQWEFHGLTWFSAEPNDCQKGALYDISELYMHILCIPVSHVFTVITLSVTFRWIELICLYPLYWFLDTLREVLALFLRFLLKSSLLN